MTYKNVFLKIERLLLYLNIFFALLLLISYLTAVISPQKFWPLPFLGLIYPALLVINLVFCVYWAVRLKRYFFISAFSVMLGAGILLNVVGFNIFHTALPATPHLRLMTYNVHNFRTLDTPVHLPANRQILNVIDKVQPDVIGFEEFYMQSVSFKICDSLAKTLHTTQYYFEPFLNTGADSTGLALFSKYPIVNRGIIRLSNDNDDNQGIYIDIKYESRIVRVYDFHLHSIVLEPQDYYLLDNFYRKKVVSKYGLRRIVSKLKYGFIIRGHQVDLIRQYAAKCPYPYVFMGDFNDTPNSYAFNQMAKGMKNAFQARGRGIGKTFNGGFASFQIDYILVSKQFDVLDYQVVHKVISDHFPVYSDVVLK